MIITDVYPPRGNIVIRVLFVCLGNICRSPTAEGIFRKLVEEAGLAESITVDSAGTSDWHIGGPPDERAQETAKRKGIDLSSQKARQVCDDDFHVFDYIIAMDGSNHLKLSALCPDGEHSRIRMCLSFASGVEQKDVPDPYYDDGFDGVFSLLENAGQGLLTEIRQTHHL